MYFPFTAALIADDYRFDPLQFEVTAGGRI